MLFSTWVSKWRLAALAATDKGCCTDHTYQCVMIKTQWLDNSHANLTKKNQKKLKLTTVLLRDTKKNLKSVPFTKILG